MSSPEDKNRGSPQPLTCSLTAPRGLADLLDRRERRALVVAGHHLGEVRVAPAQLAAQDDGAHQREVPCHLHEAKLRTGRVDARRKLQQQSFRHDRQAKVMRFDSLGLDGAHALGCKDVDRSAMNSKLAQIKAPKLSGICRDEFHGQRLSHKRISPHLRRNGAQELQGGVVRDDHRHTSPFARKRWGSPCQTLYHSSTGRGRVDLYSEMDELPTSKPVGNWPIVGEERLLGAVTYWF